MKEGKRGIEIERERERERERARKRGKRESERGGSKRYTTLTSGLEVTLGPARPLTPTFVPISINTQKRSV